MTSPDAPTTDKPEAGPSGKVAIVKKYANRRLYNTATSSYVTLEELSHMVRKGDDFLVYDAKTNEDITRSVLTQIILEEDSKGRNLLPIGFLRQLISFYDDNLHAFLPRYLEMSMENFSKHQDQIRAYMEQTFGRFFPINQFEDMARQNLAIFQRAATIWSPNTGDVFASANGVESHGPARSVARPGGEDAPSLDRQMRELRERMESLQAQLSELQTRGR